MTLVSEQLKTITPRSRPQRVIEYKRGVTKRAHPSGMDVYMYKQEPGVYLDAFGKRLPDTIAAAAGFDTERMGKNKSLQDKLAAAKAKIEDQFKADLLAERNVVEKRGEFVLLALQGGRGMIEDADGNLLTPTPLMMSMAKEVFTELVGPVVAPAATKATK